MRRPQRGEPRSDAPRPAPAKAQNRRKQASLARKPAKTKSLSFAFYYFLESGLFKGLGAIQITFFSPLLPSPCGGLSRPLVLRRPRSGRLEGRSHIPLSQPHLEPCFETRGRAPLLSMRVGVRKAAIERLPGSKSLSLSSHRPSLLGYGLNPANKKSYNPQF